MIDTTWLAPDPTRRSRWTRRHEAHEPPEARGRRRDDVRLMVSSATPHPSTPASPSSADVPRPRRPRRGQHVGHGAGRDRRPLARRRCRRRPRLERAARRAAGWSRSASPSAATTAPGASTSRVAVDLARRGRGPAPRRRSPIRSGCGWRSADLGGRARAHRPARRPRPADPLPVRARATGRSTPTRPSSRASPAAPRCRARPVRSPPSW